jgi:hypothetical protein
MYRLKSIALNTETNNLTKDKTMDKTMKYLKSVKEIHDELKKGNRVFWANENYEVKQTPIRRSRYLDHDLAHYSLDAETQTILDLRCISNYFGGLLHETEVCICFVLED